MRCHDAAVGSGGVKEHRVRFPLLTFLFSSFLVKGDFSVAFLFVVEEELSRSQFFREMVGRPRQNDVCNIIYFPITGGAGIPKVEAIIY